MPFLVSGQINTYSFFQAPTATILFLEYFSYMPYFTVTLCPFVCLFILWRESHGEKRLMVVIFRRHRAVVQPITTRRNNVAAMNN